MAIAYAIMIMTKRKLSRTEANNNYKRYDYNYVPLL